MDKSICLGNNTKDNGKRSNTLALSSSKYSMEEAIDFPSWFSGFTDGEGCFLISFNENAGFKLKLEVRPSFSIGQGKHRTSYKSRTHILCRIGSYCKCGGLRIYERDGMKKLRSSKIIGLV